MYSTKTFVYMVIDLWGLPRDLSWKDAESTEGITQSSVL